MSQPVLPPLGKYQLVRKLATGGMAEVFLAKVAGPGGFEKTLVLKRVLPQLAEDENFIGMFLSEAKLAAQLNHPNVVSIFDFGQEGTTWFLVMEYIDGPNLRSLYRRAFEIGQPPAFNLAAKIISQACEGLAYAHEFVDPETGEPMNLVHRDVSPDNILLGRNGGVKVVDFGIAKAANQTHHTKTGTIKGKFAYMPPEQLRGQQLDRRSDVFALGIVLYELISGGKPFDCATDATIMQAILFEPFRPASEQRPDCPPELQRILDRALAKDRENRYSDCREMQADLDHFIVTQGASVGQHQLAQLVARLANPNAVAMATPSKPSEPNLPRAPGSGPRPNPSAPRPPSSRPDARSAFDATQPAMPTPAPMKAAAPSRPAAPRFEPSSASTMPMPALEISAFAAAAPRAKKRNLTPVFAFGALALIAAAGTYAWMSGQPHPIPAPEFAVPVAKVADPIPPPSIPTPVVIAQKPPPIAEPAPVIEAAKPAPIKTTKTPRPHEPVKVAHSEIKRELDPVPPKVDFGLVDIRVRPYASVFVDGAFLGVTPFPKVKLAVGVHNVKLINKDIGKEITLKYEVNAGDNSLKYNLETE